MDKKYVEVQSRGLTLRGFLELPDGPGPHPLLVMFHGFTGNMGEKHFVLARLSRAVVAAGVATLRFDFGGSGESDGDFGEMTPKTEMADGLEILRFAETLPEVDPGRVMLFGFSLGGFVATNVAAAVPEKVERLVLMSPGGEPHKRQERMLKAEGWCGRGSLVLSPQYIYDGYEMDPFAAAELYPGHVTIVQGTDDAAVPASTAAEYALHFPDAEVRYVEGADHSYDSADWFAELVGHVVAAVTAPALAAPAGDDGPARGPEGVASSSSPAPCADRPAGFSPQAPEMPKNTD